MPIQAAKIIASASILLGFILAPSPGFVGRAITPPMTLRVGQDVLVTGAHFTRNFW